MEANAECGRRNAELAKPVTCDELTKQRSDVRHGEWSELGSRDIDHTTRGARVRERERSSQLVCRRIRKLGRGQSDAERNFGGVNGAGRLAMVGQFFGDGFGEFGTEMPEKGVPPGTEQAHEAVANQNEAGELKKSFGDEVVHKVSDV